MHVYNGHKSLPVLLNEISTKFCEYNIVIIMKHPEPACKELTFVIVNGGKKLNSLMAFFQTFVVLLLAVAKGSKSMWLADVKHIARFLKGCKDQ